MASPSFALESCFFRGGFVMTEHPSVCWFYSSFFGVFCSVSSLILVVFSLSNPGTYNSSSLVALISGNFSVFRV